ncbi:M4 family metallopeptidase [Frigidibacter sp. RF13]|uniref:M4 family metallopeptidase n=1 Tax=Frigidibacter sp. RF13 TaxID=2997340 RepID=UPI0022702263|nr:M4 family metallopeptidase [Frigidibacter sp. RF13]MCY1127948.1 M4 family metallopeptidase [Frigidibacter sp. RF13]
MCGHCFIIPQDVLERLSHDEGLEMPTRAAMERTALLDAEIRKLRIQNQKLTRLGMQISPGLEKPMAATPPKVLIYDCQRGTTLPGVPVLTPGSSGDVTARTAFTETTELAKFYSKVFGRNSIDDQSMSLVSSIHYGVDYNNAFWNGVQMTYGDGDGRIFLDFTKGNDVIAHEITHGVTQHTIQLAYTNQAGGLNESLSDVFGSMFRQWQAGQTVATADWLIGADIMGPAARAGGYSCLRDMANPAAKHALAPQITHFSQYKNGMDPHHSSGVPNLAFTTAAKALGGKSWEKMGQIWYKAMTGYRPSPNLRMAAFARRTRKAAASLYPKDAKVMAALDQGWKKVGL